MRRSLIQMLGIVAGLEIVELAEIGVELELDVADRPMALLGDDHLGLVVHRLAALEPVLVAQVELVLALVPRAGSGSRATGSTPRGRRTSPRPRPARSSPIRAGRTASAACPRAIRRRATSCDRASTGTLSSLAIAFRPWVISVISCTRLCLASGADAAQQLQIVDHQQIAGPACRLSRRARVRSAAIERAGVSSMNSGQRAELLAGACTTRSANPPRPMSPRRRRSELDPPLARQQAGRQLLGRHLQREHADDVVAVARPCRCSAGTLAEAAALAAIVTASAVLPMLGRPARITRSEGCRPPSFWSRPVSRVGTPGDLADLVPGALDVLDRRRSAPAGTAELAPQLALLRQGEQLALGRLDLLAAASRAAPGRRRG